MPDLSGKNAVVVGGTRGIGRAICLALAEAGAHTVVTGRSERAAQHVVDELTAAGGKGSAAALDIARPDEAAAAIDAIEGASSIDIVVANAGVNPYFERPEKLTPSQWDEVLGVNSRGVFFVVQAAARHMLRRNAGAIVSISSASATVGVPRGLPYTSSKGGINAMTRSLAVDWADRGVRVNAVAPGYIETDLTAAVREHDSISTTLLGKIPLARFGAPREIAAAVAFLASDEASYITGQTLYVDGGMEVL